MPNSRQHSSLSPNSKFYNNNETTDPQPKSLYSGANDDNNANDDKKDDSNKQADEILTKNVNNKVDDFKNSAEWQAPSPHHQRHSSDSQLLQLLSTNPVDATEAGCYNQQNRTANIRTKGSGFPRPWKSVKRRFQRTSATTAPSSSDTSSLPTRYQQQHSPQLPRSQRLSLADTHAGASYRSIAVASTPMMTASASQTHRLYSQRLTLQQSQQRQQQDYMVLPTGSSGGFATNATDTAMVLASFERNLRTVVIAVVAFWVGSTWPIFRSVASKLVEYGLVAWITCVVLRVATAYQSTRLSSSSEEERQPLLNDEEEEDLNNNNIDVEFLRRVNPEKDEEAELEEDLEEKKRFILDDEEQQRQSIIVQDKDLEEWRIDEILNAEIKAEHHQKEGVLATASGEHATQNVNHPALDPFYVIELASGARVFANTSGNTCASTTTSYFELDTEYFSGQMVILIRTPDVDDEDAVKGNALNDLAVKYFRGKQRRFEFRYQVKLKRIPKGRVYFSVEFTKSVKMGMIQRAFVSAALAFIKTTNNNLHYSISGTPESSNGKWEPPNIAFPIEEGMDIVIATPPGEKPPNLDSELHESEASIKKRRKGLQIDWNVEHTYTFALWSAYCDFLQWKVLNLPGIRPFSLGSVIGPQPIVLSLYELPDNKENNGKNHYRCDLVNIVRFEMCHAEHSGKGPATIQWIKNNTSEVKETQTPGTSDLNLIEEADEDLETDIEDDEVESDGEGAAVEVTPTVARINGESAAEELGEGIYVRSGDAIMLREAMTNEDALAFSSNPGYLSSGGGFAVFQEQTTSTIIIEKAGKSRMKKSSRSASRLIKTGDTVIFKLVSRGRHSDDVDTKYLSIHRGWWLKWVSTVPTKNGHFTILTHETEVTDRGDDTVQSTQIQSSYLTFGCSFWLRHKRWSKYYVGVAADASTRFGGRILGLHIPSEYGGGGRLGDSKLDDQSEDGEAVRVDDTGTNKGACIRPLQFQAFEFTNAGINYGVHTKMSAESFSDNDSGGHKQKSSLEFSSDKFSMDVPAWVEYMNRTERTLAHAYVVRVIFHEIEDFRDYSPQSQRSESNDQGSFVCLRKGRDLALVMRAGVNSASYLQKSIVKYEEPSSPVSEMRRRSLSSPVLLDSSAGADLYEISAYSFDEAANRSLDSGRAVDVSDEEWEVDSVESSESSSSVDVGEVYGGKRHRKGRHIIGKIARSVKTGTSKTGRSLAHHGAKVGKTTVSAGVKVGKSTVTVVNYAGKSILPMRTKNQPPKEPRTNKRKTRKRQVTDLRVDVTSRSLKRIETLGNSSVMAGQLTAPEQSRRVISNMVARMSAELSTSPLNTNFSTLLRSLVATPSEPDSSFLQGGAVELGVAPGKVDSEMGALVIGAVVARCMWDSHWREEWVGVFEGGVLFYAPFTRSPCLEISFEDIESVRFLDEEAKNPLAGYPVLIVETAWMCTYFAFSSLAVRQSFFEKVETRKSHDYEVNNQVKQLAEARFWQGFQTSIETSRSIGAGKWASVSSGSKIKTRAILNNRRMKFDLHGLHEIENQHEFVESLLSTALSFSLDTLQKHPEDIIRFLDGTSCLQNLSLDIDRSTPAAYCLFVNIYHCLLQHALLFSVNGSLQKRSFNHFMRTSCYEIGGDVFSLAELNACIIRGKMSRPVFPKPPFIEPPKKSSAYRFYALGFTTPKTNFLLSTADLQSPREIPVLTLFNLEDELDSQAAAFIRRTVTVDVAKKVATLPKLFEVYRGDFSGEATILNASIKNLRFCLRYLDGPRAAEVRALLQEDDASIVIKYHPAAEHFHSILCQKIIADSTAQNTTL